MKFIVSIASKIVIHLQSNRKKLIFPSFEDTHSFNLDTATVYFSKAKKKC